MIIYTKLLSFEKRSDIVRVKDLGIPFMHLIHIVRNDCQLLLMGFNFIKQPSENFEYDIKLQIPLQYP